MKGRRCACQLAVTGGDILIKPGQTHCDQDTVGVKHCILNYNKFKQKKGMNTLTLVNYPLCVSFQKRKLLLFMSKDIYCGALHVQEGKETIIKCYL